MLHLTRPTQISLNQILDFLLAYWHTGMQKSQCIQSVHFWDTVNFRVLWPDWPHPFLTIPTQKSFDQLLIFMNLYQHAKNQFIPFVHSSDTVNFRVQIPDWKYPFFTMLNQNIFKQLLIFVNLHQHAKMRKFHWCVLQK